MPVYNKIYLFDDCDSIVLAALDEEAREKHFIEMLRFLVEILRPLLAAEWKVTAYLGPREYQLSSKENDVPKSDNCGWLKDETEFQTALKDSIAAAREAAAREAAARPLFLVDWSMSNLTWVPKTDGMECTVLNWLVNCEEGLKGDLICYTSSLDDEKFKQGFQKYVARFQNSKTGLRPVKLLWRWNDTPSTIYTLLHILQEQLKLRG